MQFATAPLSVEKKGDDWSVDCAIEHNNNEAVPGAAVDDDVIVIDADERMSEDEDEDEVDDVLSVCSASSTQPAQPPATETTGPLMLIVIHSNFRMYGGPRTREVRVEDLVGMFIGDIETGRGYILRHIAMTNAVACFDYAAASSSARRRHRGVLARAVFRDKFLNERNLVPFDGVETIMCLTPCDMIERAAEVMRTLGSHRRRVYVKLPAQVKWVLQSIRSVMPDHERCHFLDIPRSVRADKVYVNGACVARANHNTVACELCLFHCYRAQMQRYLVENASGCTSVASVTN